MKELMTEQQFRDKHKGKCSYVNREKELDELVADAYSLASNDGKPLVVGRSEHFICSCELPSSNFELDDGTICCCRCEKTIAN